jgi:hypothetical protein
MNKFINEFDPSVNKSFNKITRKKKAGSENNCKGYNRIDKTAS